MFRPPAYEFEVRFFGPTNVVEYPTLLGYIDGFNKILEASVRDLGSSGKLNLDVRAVRPGSVEIKFLLHEPAIDVIKNLFLAATPIAPKAVEYATQVMNLAKFMQGKPAVPTLVDGDKNTVINASGQSAVYNIGVLHLYGQPSVKEGISGAFEALRASEAVETVEIADTFGNPLHEADKTESAEVALNLYETQDATHRTKTRREDLGILGTKFDTRYKWEFLRNGVRIHAAISDPGFQEKIARREEMFGAGDALDVDLEIMQEKDAGSGLWIDKGYRVMRVWDHRPGGGQQQSLPLLPPTDNAA